MHTAGYRSLPGLIANAKKKSDKNSSLKTNFAMDIQDKPKEELIKELQELLQENNSGGYSYFFAREKRFNRHP